MKTILTIAITALVIGSAANAKRGGNRGDDNATTALRPAKTSAVGFITESIEHSVRLLYAADQAIANQVVGTEAALNPASKQVEVLIAKDNGEVKKFACSQVEEFSQSGTVKKLEVRCIAQ